MGLVGSDVVNEYFYENEDLEIEPISLMRDEQGNSLRFALIEPIGEVNQGRCVTSYPETAKRVLGDGVEFIEAGGGIEAEVQDLLVPGFELVLTGNSVRENGLVIVADNLAMVSLCRIVKKR